MIPTIKTILYTTDLGPLAKAVFRYTVMLAEKLEARIALLHVTEPLTPTAQSLLHNVLPDGTAESIRREGMQQLQKDVRQQLNTFCREELGEDAEQCPVVSEIHVVEGAPAAMILSQAESIRADLIVLGTHGRTGVGAMLLGSVAHKVSQQSDIPVLLVPLRA